VPIDETAPGELELVRTFLNTVHFLTGDEGLATPHALRAWLVEHGLLSEGAALGDAEFERALAVREAIRDLVDANYGDEVPDVSLRTLREASVRAPLRFSFERNGAATAEPAVGGLDGALGRLLGIVYDAMRQGEWSRLKTCRDPRCRWLFYDRSKNRSGAWCDMASCGNRAKARRRRASARD
jgi:predicted RNA-binding Zn ribbon-like protein